MHDIFATLKLWMFLLLVVLFASSCGANLRREQSPSQPPEKPIIANAGASPLENACLF